MSRLGRAALWVMGIAVGVVAAVAVARTPAPSLAGPENVDLSGTLRIVWHADPARGCAARGLCGETGTIIVDPQGFGAVASQARSHELVLFSSTAEARVRRVNTADASDACIDTVPAYGLTVRMSAHGTTAAIGGAGPTAGRCAGPVAPDLIGLRLPVKVRGSAGAVTVDLRGHTRFTGGPFSGEVISTLQARPDTSGLPLDSGFSLTGSSAPPKHPHRPVRVRVHTEYVTLRYRLTGPLGQLHYRFTGDSDLTCATYDSCGATGQEWVSAPPRYATFTVTAERPVKRQLGAGRALHDLVQGDLELRSGFAATVRSTVREGLLRPDGSLCSDGIAEPLTLSASFRFGAQPIAPALPLSLSYDGVPESGAPLRTHCPGPETWELAGTGEDGSPLDFSTLAGGEVPDRELGRRQLTVALDHNGPVAGGGYTGTADGAWLFALQLVSRHAGTHTEVVTR